MNVEELCKECNIKLRRIQATAQSLLNRNAHGDYKFSHKSMRENGFNGYEMLKEFIKEKIGVLYKMYYGMRRKNYRLLALSILYKWIFRVRT